VARAQWQFFLATGDTTWLACCGYPVIRETADFWASRVSLDTARGRYDVRDVVSVDEGLVGVTNDAYTNAVARSNLRIATTASRLLGRAANPRWAEVAEKLSIPYDSVGEYHRTYDGAPPATLGSVVPLLAYPLDVPMSARAKRTDLDHALRRLATEGSGAMMTVTLYPVVAAELGDRALVDTLLPQTYRSYLRGPFLVLGETPRSDAVSFVTGAGGFLQQVIYGYTGLRLGDAGLVRAFPPLPPSRLGRLLLRNVHVRGTRYDVLVEGDSLRMISRGPDRETRRRTGTTQGSGGRAAQRR
jgi:trehalose/maltose hydrolase-like predicted phosphorylase